MRNTPNYTLNEQEVDLSTIGITLHIKHYLQNVELSFPIYMEPYRLVVPWPKEENRLLAPIRPFQPWVSYTNYIDCSILYLCFFALC